MIYSHIYELICVLCVFYASSYVVNHTQIHLYFDALRSVSTQNDLRSDPSPYLCSGQGADPYIDPCFKLRSDLRTDRYVYLYTDLRTDLCSDPCSVLYTVQYTVAYVVILQ